MALSRFFKSKTADTAVSAPASDPTNPNDLRNEETYHHWGKRICGTNDGNTMVLAPFLQNVYNYVYKRQIENKKLQEERKNRIKAEISICENNIEHDNQQIEDHLQKIEEIKGEIDKQNSEKMELRANGRKVAPNANAKMIIGLVILVPLTLYLFLFYSSTFFSGFLAGKSAIKDAAGAMFNAKCFDIVWKTSVPEFFFMLLFPVIFLGLGFALHFFSEEKKKSKYLKMTAIILVTFAFDCILAYRIGRNIHDYMVLNGIIPKGDYTVSMAIKDINTWAVIFCGFIAYIIWGIVFDQLMDAYSGLNQNQIEIEAINEKIELFNSDIQQENNTIQNLRDSVKNTKNKIVNLSQDLNSNVFIDNNEIKICLTDFFTGWMTMMDFLGCPNEKQAEAQQVFRDLMIQYKLNS